MTTEPSASPVDESAAADSAGEAQAGASENETRVGKPRVGKPKSLLSRRRFLTAAAGLAAAGLGTYTVAIEPRWVTTSFQKMPIPGLPAELVGKRAVQISDLHVGHRVGTGFLEQQFERVDSLQPDFVFFTGDFLDNASDWHLEQGRKLLKKFPRGRLGNACVLGNHDYGNDRRYIAQYAQNSVGLVELFNDAGLNLLRDETVELSGLKIAGLRDFWNGQFRAGSAAEVISDASRGAGLVLSHNPDTVDLPIWDEYQSWVLCGHTHGGQCRFPFVGAPILPVLNKRYVSGAYQIEGGHRLFISRGIGHTHRVRFMAPPEISVFELTTG